MSSKKSETSPARDLTVEQEIRTKALGFAVERFKNLPAASCPPELVIASAKFYAIFIEDGSVGNSNEPE
jgi:hypothetical protein